MPFEARYKTLVEIYDSGLKAHGRRDLFGTKKDGRWIWTTYGALLASGHTAARVDPTPDEVATLLYTSGTTGNPEGVLLTHANIASNVSAAAQLFPIRHTDRSLSILPWAHAFGQTGELHTFVSRGASIAICEGVDKILENLAEVKPTILACVP